MSPSAPSPQRSPTMTDSERGDWDDLRRRMMRAEAVLDAITSERPPSGTPRPGSSSPVRAEITLFSRGDQSYALTSRRVLRIVRLEELLRIPTAPPSLLAATFAQGDLVPVF